jgi:hypothetical protein
MVVRAKFRCNTEGTRIWGRQDGDSQRREYDFTAVYDNGSPENQRFVKATPVGHLTITVDNPAVVFEPGQDYYLDFTPVEADAS